MALCCVRVAAAADPDEFRIWPMRTPSGAAGVFPDSPSLIKALGDAAALSFRWPVPRTRADWESRRPAALGSFRRAIGLEQLPERTPLRSRILARHEFGDHTIENVTFESRPGFPVTANLYRPNGRAGGRRPAILSPIGHYLSAGKSATAVQSRAIGLARMGFVVLTYDAIGQGERLTAGNIHHEAGYALLPVGETIAGWMVWDSMRAIDYLESLTDVDPARIGMTGNSGGGLNTLFTAALDERIAAAAVVGFTFEFRNWIQYGSAHCTCTHLPGLLKGMEWFEIAGLIAPRSLLMLQGERDAIFPAAGARRAAAGALEVYRLAGNQGRARFVELAGQPHEFTLPFREVMYRFFAEQLLTADTKFVSPESAAAGPLTETDRRLQCDPDRKLGLHARTVVMAAREQAESLSRLPGRSIRNWIDGLRESEPASLPLLPTPPRPGRPEKIVFQSEEGLQLPALLWKAPAGQPDRGGIVLVDGRGKAHAAELAFALSDAGYAVAAPDVRGHGELLDEHRPGWNINFRLVASHVLAGAPVAERRAHDVRKTIDLLAARGAASDGVTVIGVGEDAIPALISAALDQRVRRVMIAGTVHSFSSLMRERRQIADGAKWNDPQLRGVIDAGEFEVGFGSVIPGILRHGDIADLVAEVAGVRPVLFCDAVDRDWPPAAAARARFEELALRRKALTWKPGAALSPGLAMEWMQASVRP